MRWAPTWATTLGDHRYDDRLAPRDAAAIDAIDRRARRAARAARGDRSGAARRRPIASRTRCCASRLEAEHGARRVQVARVGGRLRRRQPVRRAVVPRRVAHREDARRRDEPGRADAPGRRADRRHDREPRARARGRARVVGREGAARDRAARRRAREAGRELGDGDARRGPRAGARSVAGGRARPPARRAARRRGRADRARDRRATATSCAIACCRARAPSAKGLAGLPDGDACYRASILLPRRAADDARASCTRSAGARSRAPIASSRRSARRVLGTPDLASTIARLRGDPALYFALARGDPRRGAERARSREGGDAAVLLGAAEDRLRDARDPRRTRRRTRRSRTTASRTTTARSPASTSSTRTSRRRARASSSRR